jgi:DNA helicase-2/ATP-dependent DNA helicase PcrA
MTAFEPHGQQRKAAESTAAHLLVIAPPGCGKTELLAMRAEHLVRSGQIRPHRRLLAITYSKRARDNMRQRIEQRLGSELFRKNVTVLNFHGLAGRIVRAHAASLHIPRDFVMPGKRWFADTATALNADWKARKTAEERLLALKSQPLSDGEIQAQLTGGGDELALAIERARIESNRLDYPDLIRHAQRLLAVPEIARLYQAHFDAMLVDEFQDLSVQQLDIVSLTCSRSATFVGDPLQGIYSWAGAQPDEVGAMLEARCSERIDLDVSYRSAPEVLEMVNAVGVPIGATALRAADPDSWGSAFRTRAAVFADDDSEAERIADTATEMVRREPACSVGIIARSGPRRAALDRALARVDDVPLQFWDMALDHPGLLTSLRAAAVGIAGKLPLETQLELLRSRVLTVIGEDDVDTENAVDDAIALLAERAAEGEGVRAILARTRAVDVEEVAAPGVHVLNAHLGKGQQFDWVFVIGLEEGHVPDWRNPDDPEEARVLMVMLSRAKQGLVVSRADAVNTKYGMKRVAPSRWWGALEDAAQKSK